MPDEHFLSQPEKVTLMPGAREILLDLRNRGFVLALVTNQSGVARGLMSEAEVQAVNHKLQELLQLEFDSIAYCPHHPEGKITQYRMECPCRKPKPGLLLQVLRQLGYRSMPKGSFLVGDAIRDCEAAMSAGIPAFLLHEIPPQYLPTNSRWIPSLLNLSEQISC